jgi:hypothetical protein
LNRPLKTIAFLRIPHHQYQFVERALEIHGSTGCLGSRQVGQAKKKIVTRLQNWHGAPQYNATCLDCFRGAMLRA